jgi:signal recognition particle subunit SRP68
VAIGSSFPNIKIEPSHLGIVNCPKLKPKRLEAITNNAARSHYRLRAERLPSMDITSFVVQGRDKALLYGDYSTYHAQLCKRLLNSRKRLGIATRNRGKFHKTGQLSPEEVAQNIE